MEEPLPKTETSPHNRADSDPENWSIWPDSTLTPAGLQHDIVVHVRGKYIVAVGSPGPAGSDEERVIRAPGSTLIPGLIDSHSHLTFSGGENTVEYLTSESDLTQLARAVGNAQTALSSGVTTVVDCGGRTSVVTTLKCSIGAGLLAGPTLLVSGAPITTSEGHCHWLGGVADAPNDVQRRVRELAAANADFVKLMLTGGNLTSTSNPEALQYPAAIVKMIADECNRLGKPLVVHAHTREGLLVAAESGARIIAHASCLDGQGNAHLKDSDLRLLLDSKVVIDPTLAVAFNPETMKSASTTRGQQRDAVIPLLRRMHEAGIPLLAGSDAGVPGVAHDRVAVSVSALHREVGLSLEEALMAATRAPALALGIDDRVGSIIEGMHADLVLVENLESDIGGLTRPTAVWKQGELVQDASSIWVSPQREGPGRWRW